MRLFILFIVSSQITFGNCGFTTISSASNSYLTYISSENSTESYQEVLRRINKERLELRVNRISIDSCRTYFLDQFEHHVFPHWVGTEWDYNGYTNVPGPGKIVACGYFVSTPLKHMGFNWNRYELAKMYSKNIVETITPDITEYRDKFELIQTLKQREDNLYIVGLDSHVGMLLKTDNRVWFVHSNYYGNKGPDKEIASVSQAFSDSGSWYVGTFTTDENIQKWLKGTLINTVRDK